MQRSRVEGALLAEGKEANEGKREMTQEEANEIIRNLDTTRIMWPHKEEKREPWSAEYR